METRQFFHRNYCLISFVMNRLLSSAGGISGIAVPLSFSPQVFDTVEVPSASVTSDDTTHIKRIMSDPMIMEPRPEIRPLVRSASRPNLRSRGSEYAEKRNRMTTRCVCLRK